MRTRGNKAIRRVARRTRTAFGSLTARTCGARPPLDAGSRENQALTVARTAFFYARITLCAVLEDLIEAETRASHQTATDLSVEVYNDELGEPRGRLVAVNTVGHAGQPDDALAEQIADLLDEWAVTADTDRTEIFFKVVPPVRPGRAER